MNRRVLHWLVNLYPRWWQDRYGEEAAAALDDLPVNARSLWDMLAGCADAWLHQRPPSEIHRYAPEFHQALMQAQNEAFRLNCDHIGSEHLLLGILAHRKSRASQLLTAAGVTPSAVRNLIVPLGDEGGRVDRLPAEQWMTPRAKRILERSGQDADRLGALTVSPEHLLLAMVEQSGGVGLRILLDLGVDLDLLRAVLRGSS